MTTEETYRRFARVTNPYSEELEVAQTSDSGEWTIVIGSVHPDYDNPGIVVGVDGLKQALEELGWKGEPPAFSTS